ncbi:MAG TPA: hypothetical protein DCK76_01745 [Desulfotomaculum sp.]|nr:MAG: hypothetical protein XD78_1901 [Desulfotomaculum sp. 46_296]HAG10124.1 hypothetical protein [Desulfotomaculum sp.]HBY03780.1 hypothetical protein [Desulfotomaculum sp.]
MPDNELTEVLVEKFADIFQGLTSACGRLYADEKRGWCNKTPVTLQQYGNHLTGTTYRHSLGIYPLQSDGNVWFCAIDSDNHNEEDQAQLAENAAALRDKLSDLGIIAHIERSKSGGYHIWIFFCEPVPVAQARRLLRQAWQEAIGGTTPEIFPKQDSFDGLNYGNFINLPYFPPSVKNNRRVVTDGGTALTLEQFLDIVRRHTRKELNTALAMLPKEPEQPPKTATNKERPAVRNGFKDLLPCAKNFMEKGALNGPRRPALFRLAAHMNRANYPYEIALTSVRIADEKNSPPILDEFGPDELEHHVKSAYNGKNGAGYVSLGCDEADWVTRFCTGKETCPVHERPSPEQEFALDWEGNPEVKKQKIIVVNNRSLPSITEEALAALAASNYPEILFNRAGEITKISHIQEKDKHCHSFTRPVLKSVNEASLRGYLARSARYVKAREKSGDVKYLPAIPPPELVRDIMSLDNLPLPLLRGITQVPIMRGDGSLFITPGYDAGTSLYYAPEPGSSLPEIPDRPVKTDVEASLGRLRDILADFPFDSGASWANILAAVITPVLRDLIAGPVPMLLIDKPLQGTGASLLSDVISMISTGASSYMTTAPEGRDREDEWRKRVTSILSAGRPVVVIDNVEDVFHSSTLCALLTSVNWSDRILGRNEIINLQHRTCWVITGNNIRLAGDLPRRCYRVRLDANRARPWQRDQNEFRHPYLTKYVKENRGALLAAIFTLARAWVLAGQPAPVKAPPMGSFEEWREVIGGILEFADVNEFLGNAAEIYENAEINEGIEDLIESWHKVFGSKPITVKQIEREITFNAEFRDVLPDWLDPSERGFTRKLGRVLARKSGVYFTNGYKLEKCGAIHRAFLWKVDLVM